MKKQILRFASLLCAAAVLMCACGKKDDEKNKPVPYDSAADFREDEGEMFQDVPRERYEGYTFRVLSAKTGNDSSKIDSDSITGSVISDAVYQRNINVQSRLGIVIEETRETPENVYKIAVNSVLAHEDLYSAVWNYSSYMGAMAAGGYLVSSDYLLEADYEKPWWNTRAMDENSVADARFLLYSDIQMSFYDAHSLVGINMDMYEKLDGLSDPYALMDSGEWTWNAMYDMVKAASRDVDGNSIMNSEDTYGIAVESDSVLPLMFACGARMSEKDELDLPYITCYDNEKFFDVYTLISQSLFSGGTSVYDVTVFPEDDTTALEMFRDEKSLFVVTTVGELDALRAMESEFGVLPMPKYADYQSDYISYISGNSACALGIPVTGANFLRTGVIIENLAAETWRDGGLRDIYLDSILEFRYVNDDLSRKALDVILETGTFDLAEIYGWGELSDTVTALAAGGAEKLASTLAKDQPKIDADMYNFIDMILEWY